MMVNISGYVMEQVYTVRNSLQAYKPSIVNYNTNRVKLYFIFVQFELNIDFLTQKHIKATDRKVLKIDIAGLD